MNLAKTIDILAGRKLDGKTTFQGLEISIENRKGSVRRGVSPDGKKWATKMSFPYGYIRKTMGVDGDHIDCFIGPNLNATTAYIVHVKKPPKFEVYDEDKCFLGFNSKEAAEKAFYQNYDKKEFFGGIDEIPMEKFREKVLETKDNPQKIVAGGEGSGCKGANCGRPVYHGTTLKQARMISKYGLRVPKNPDSLFGKRIVFTTASKAEAIRYARATTDLIGGHGAVVVIDPKRAGLKSFKEVPRYFVSKKHVPVEAIMKIVKLGYHRG